MRKINMESIPFQVIDLINKLNGKDNFQAKENYKNRLEDIRDIVTNAIVTYESQEQNRFFKKRGKASE